MRWIRAGRLKCYKSTERNGEKDEEDSDGIRCMLQPGQKKRNSTIVMFDN